MKFSTLTILTFLLCLHTCFALDIDANPREIWIGDSVNIFCYSNESGMKAYITSPMYQLLSDFVFEGSYYRFGYKPPLLGTYNVFCSDETVNSSQTSFDVSDLNIFIRQSPEGIYTSDDLEIRAEVIKTTDSEESLQSGVDFTLFLDGNEIPVNENPPYFYNGEWVITGRVPELEPGNYMLKLDAEHKGKIVYDEKELEIYPDMEFYIFSVIPENVAKGMNVTAKLVAKYYGNTILDKIIDNVSVTINSENAVFERVGDNIIIQLPDTNPESYELNISVDYSGDVNNDGISEEIETSSARRIGYLVRIDGEMLDSKGISISGTINLIRDNWKKTIKLTDGLYSDQIPKGTYTAEMLFPELSATFTGVRFIEDVDDFVRYYSFQDISISGMKLASGFALEFGLGFDRVSLEIEYNDANVKDEKNLEVYRCPNWNFGARVCAVGWEEISAEIDTIRNRVRFGTSHLSAFIIGEKKSLQVEGSLDKSECYLGDSVVLTGVIRDEDGKLVDKVLVSYSVYDITGEATTDHSGIFSITFDAPDEKGRFDILMNASKVFFIPASMNKEISVIEKKDITFILPLSASSYVDKESEFKVSILNSGQARLHDIRIDVTGIPGIDFHPQTLEELNSGEDFDIYISIIPEEKENYPITVSVRSLDSEDEEFQESDVFVLMVRDKVEAQEPSTDTIPITAYLIANSSSLLTGFSLLIAGTIIFLLIRRIKRTRSGNRMYIVNLIQSIEKEIMKTKNITKKETGQSAKERVEPDKSENSKEEKANEPGDSREEKSDKSGDSEEEPAWTKWFSGRTVR